MKITFRAWTKKDGSAIRCILHDTWQTAYTSFVPAIDLFSYLDQHYSVEAIEQAVSDPKVVGILAEVDNEAAGCVRMHYNADEKRLYVQQLYILPLYQRLGIGRRLMEFSAVRAKLLGLDRVWLGVMVKNKAALEWYKKMDYTIAETMPFVIGKTTVDHYIGYVVADKISIVPEKQPPHLFSEANLSKIKLVFDSSHPDGILPKYCCDLLERQKTEWQQLAEGHSALNFVKTRELSCRSYNVTLQYNPKRIASTTANTDPKVISERKCFLCLNNLPAEQMGILYSDEYLILCNPAPIFPAHFTIINIQHIQQDFEKSIASLLDLAKDLSPDFTIFYNGPKGGASAPDHLHFQVTPRRQMQVENDAVDMHRREKFYYKDHVAGFTLKDYSRAALIIESTKKEKLLELLFKLVSVWKQELNSSEEPIMNVLCSYQEDIWRVIIFPRTKHRPDVYFKEGDERIVVSPAAVDIGGLIVTPLEKDFLRIDAKLVEEIYSEVCERQEVIEQIIRKLN